MTAPMDPYRWDLGLFHAIHAGAPPSHAMLAWARALADAPLVLTAGLLGVLILLPRLSMRTAACRAFAAAMLALAANGLIGLAWDRPRPFVAGVGQAWIAHAATGSFPSDHLSLQWTVAGMLLLEGRTRPWGAAIAVLGLPMAWARVYLGVHYPSDMVGALGMAALATVAGRGVLGRQRAGAPRSASAGDLTGPTLRT
ncbi:MAG TPA: phosphatase PAP2 family protein [Frateuria sp.]|uniref:phosphatase PAP2 family protein n=1 Tax=Frateuria sp. TaxID=2211372 RepID=UPI002DE61050|nr:phosphatase PAP2 family protein [Frateuria sp.]